MKAFLFFVSLLSLPLVSCRIEGDTVEYVTQGAEIFNHTVVVNPSDWQPSQPAVGQAGYYLTAKVRIADITPGILTNAAVIVYLIQETGSLKAIPLPMTTSHTNTANNVVTRTLTYELVSGYIIFRLDDSDLRTEPYDMPLKFRVAAYS